MNLMTGRQADIALAGVRVRKYVGIKDRTFIDTMLRRAAVDDPFLDQNQIPGTGGEKNRIQRNGNGAFQNADELHFLMPVKRHGIARMVFVHMIERDGKIRRAVVDFFVVIKIMHRKASLKDFFQTIGLGNGKAFRKRGFQPRPFGVFGIGCSGCQAFAACDTAGKIRK